MKKLLVLLIKVASDTIVISLENALASFTPHVHGLCSIDVFFVALKSVSFSHHRIVNFCEFLPPCFYNGHCNHRYHNNVDEEVQFQYEPEDSNFFSNFFHFPSVSSIDAMCLPSLVSFVHLSWIKQDLFLNQTGPFLESNRTFFKMCFFAFQLKVTVS